MNNVLTLASGISAGRRELTFSLWPLLLPLAGCAAAETLKSTDFVADRDGGASGRDATTAGDNAAGSGNQDASTAAPPGCGNGDLTQDEACDDGNRRDGDGCANDCLSVTPGYSCPRPGTPCQRVARCGDGVMVLPELCDDGNSRIGDGCSDTCKIEIGFKCAGAPSACTATVCGDGKQEGAESCDDGNAQPFDGCAANCQKEPDCTDGACHSDCGDGLVLPPEGCDDGNSLDGDGCSSVCRVEAGFTCSEESACEQVNGQCVLRVSAVFRDFKENHPDFSTSCDGLKTMVVKPSLNQQGRPELVSQAAADGNCISRPASFLKWYVDGPDTKTFVSSIALFDNEKGGYVNRLGADGEAFVSPGAQPFSDKPCATPFVDCVPCQYAQNQSCEIVRLDGNPLFFPLNDFAGAWPDGRFQAKVPEQYGANGWPLATSWKYWPPGYAPDATNNFSFTSEVKYWYLFNPEAPATLDFTGDDDVWVFVNGKLAVDLGGVHVPLNGNVTIDASTGANIYDMQPGKVYPITIFHAERKQEGSSFKLTLSGFNTARSDCRAFCGDSLVGLGEECDDGENDGGYGECASGCKLGEYCGDGVVQEGEDCDHGSKTVAGCGQATSCRDIVVL